jgi:hypothetical protein
LAVFLFMVATPAVADSVIYTNLGPGFTYDSGNGVPVCGSCEAGSSQAMANLFTVPAGPGYNLTQLNVAVTYNFSGTNSVMIELLADSGGSPGSTVLGSWTLTNLPTFGSVSSIQPSQTISGISGIVLSAGTQYWLAAFASASGTYDIWNYSTGTAGTIAVSNNGGTTWAPFSGVLQTAFDVRGNPLSTPEPGTMTLLGSGLIGLGLALRRKSALAKPN